MAVERGFEIAVSRDPKPKFILLSFIVLLSA